MVWRNVCYVKNDISVFPVYGFAVLDYSNLVMKPHDSWADLDNDFYGKVTEFKKYGIKVTVAIGGWNDSEGDKYSRLVNNPAARYESLNNNKKLISLNIN
jgi:chitinase